MSRIAGIFSFERPFQGESLIHKMLQASRFQPSWETFQKSCGTFSLGWTGWTAPNLEVQNGIWVALDGCIYNREDFNESFSNGAGLIRTLCQECGFENMLEKLNGDFSIVLYDENENVLWCARDRFGVKPFYFVQDSEFFAFASRPQALLMLPGVSREVNRKYVALFAVSHYRTFDNDLESSPYKDIQQLPAAHYLCIKDNKVNRKRYWKLKDLPDWEKSENELAEEYHSLLLDSVSKRLKMCQKPAFTLSGGMDSSSILASAVKILGSKQHAFSSVYVDKTYDESREIRSILDMHVAKWHPVQIGTPDVFDLISQMVAIHGEPVATATWLSHYLLCREVSSQRFSGLFGGLGGDELNAGEYEYFFFYFADLRQQGEEIRLKEEVEKWIEYHDHPVFKKSFEVMKEGLSRLVDLQASGRCLPDRRRMERYFSALNKNYFDLSSFDPVMNHPFKSYLKNRTFQDIFRETIPCCLRAEDRQTMAFNLDNFLPFFDHHLVEFMFRVPGHLKIRKGITKYLLRKAMNGVLPDETRNRVKKTGWNAPAHIWFTGKGREELLDLVHSKSFRDHGIYDRSEVLRLIEEHDQIVSSGANVENHMMFLWQLVNLELWLCFLEKF